MLEIAPRFSNLKGFSKTLENFHKKHNPFIGYFLLNKISITTLYDQINCLQDDKENALIKE